LYNLSPPLLSPADLRPFYPPPHTPLADKAPPWACNSAHPCRVLLFGVLLSRFTVGVTTGLCGFFTLCGTHFSSEVSHYSLASYRKVYTSCVGSLLAFCQPGPTMGLFFFFFGFPIVDLPPPFWILPCPLVGNPYWVKSQLSCVSFPFPFGRWGLVGYTPSFRPLCFSLPSTLDPAGFEKGTLRVAVPPFLCFLLYQLVGPCPTW